MSRILISQIGTTQEEKGKQSKVQVAILARKGKHFFVSDASGHAIVTTLEEVPHDCAGLSFCVADTECDFRGGVVRLAPSVVRGFKPQPNDYLGDGPLPQGLAKVPPVRLCVSLKGSTYLAYDVEGQCVRLNSKNEAEIPQGCSFVVNLGTQSIDEKSYLSKKGKSVLFWVNPNTMFFPTTSFATSTSSTRLDKGDCPLISCVAATKLLPIESSVSFCFEVQKQELSTYKDSQTRIEKQMQVLTGKIKGDNTITTVKLWETKFYVAPTASVVHFGYLKIRIDPKTGLFFSSTFVTELYEQEHHPAEEPPRARARVELERSLTPPPSPQTVQAEEDFAL